MRIEAQWRMEEEIHWCVHHNIKNIRKQNIKAGTCSKTLELERIVNLKSVTDFEAARISVPLINSITEIYMEVC